jgi:hypothetical protein
MQQVKMRKFWQLLVLDLRYYLYTAVFILDWISLNSLLCSCVYWWAYPYWFIQIWVKICRCICYYVHLAMRYAETRGSSKLMYPLHLHATQLYIKGTTHSYFTKTYIYIIYHTRALAHAHTKAIKTSRNILNTPNITTQHVIAK